MRAEGQEAPVAQDAPVTSRPTRRRAARPAPRQKAQDQAAEDLDGLPRRGRSPPPDRFALLEGDHGEAQVDETTKAGRHEQVGQG